MRTLRKTMALVLAIAMVLTTFGAVTVSAATYADTEGHWAEGVIDTWSGYEVIQGDGGYFRPDDPITRAEVAQITQNVIGYVTTAPNAFIDVADNAWYRDAVLKLVAADVLTGNGDGTMTPDANMTREEAMTMLSRAYGLEPVNNMASITNYADYSSISDYATGFIGAMTAAGYVGGYPDGTIRPQDNIARGEFVKILDNMIKLYITGPGTYGPGYYGGIIMVKSGGVVLDGVIADKAVISPLVSGDVETNNAQLTNGVLNLSDSATVNNENGNGSSVGGMFNGYYGGSYGGGSGSSGTRSYTVRFHVDGALYATKTAKYNTALSTILPVDPTLAGKVFIGWYESQAEADDPDSSYAVEPEDFRITDNVDFYAGFADSGNGPAPTAAPATPTPVPGGTADKNSETYNPESGAGVQVGIEFAQEGGRISGVVDNKTGATLKVDEDYTVKYNEDGSAVLEFSPDYLKSLPPGTYEFDIYTDTEGAGPIHFSITVPGETTPAPEGPTVAPEGPTAAPEQPTAAPQQPTQTPQTLYNAVLKVNGGDGELKAGQAPAEPTKAPAEATQAPSEATQAPNDNPPSGDAIVWDFSSEAWAEYAGEGKEVATETTVDGLVICGSAGKNISTATNEKVNGGKTTYLNLGGSGKWYFKYTPATDGKIAFTIHSSGAATVKSDGTNDNPRSLLIKVGSADAKAETYTVVEPESLSKDFTYDLKAGETIQVGGDGSTNGFWVTALSFTPAGGSVEPGTPTAAPAEPTKAPETPTAAPNSTQGPGGFLEPEEGSAGLSEHIKVALSGESQDIQTYYFEPVPGEASVPDTFGTDFMKVYHKEGSAPKLGEAAKSNGEAGRFIMRAGTMADFEIDLNNVLAVKVPYDSDLQIGAGQNAGSDGAQLSINVQTGLGVNNPTKTSLEYVADKNNDTIVGQTYSAKAGDIVYLWFDGSNGTFVSVTFLPPAATAAEEGFLEPETGSAGLNEHIKVALSGENQDVQTYYFEPVPGEAGVPDTFGTDFMKLYHKEGSAPKLGEGAKSNGEMGRAIMRAGTMADFEIDLNNVLAVKVPYDSDLHIAAGLNGGKAGELTSLSINVQTGLGVSNPTKTSLEYVVEGSNNETEIEQTYPANKGDIVYLWFDASNGTFRSVTFLPRTGGEVPQPTQAPSDATQAPSEATQAPANPPAQAEALVWDFAAAPFVVDGKVNTDLFPEGDHTNSAGEVDRFNIEPTSVQDINGLSYVVKETGKNNFQSSKRSYPAEAGQEAYEASWSIKTGGASADDNRYFTFTPPADGTFYIWARSGSGSNPTTVTATQNGATVGTKEYAANSDTETFSIMTFEVKAGAELRISGSNNTQYYKLAYTPAGGGSVEPGTPTTAPAEPTTAPAEPTKAPAEPTAEPGTKSYQFAAGTVVTYSGTPAEGYTMKVTAADGTDVQVKDGSFTMPAQDVRVEVTYESAETYTVSVADGITGGTVVLIPEQPTAAPAEPTAAPAEPTTAPAEPTTAPEQPTTAPEQSTTAPEQSTPGTDPAGTIIWDFGKEPFVNADGTVNTDMFPEGDHTDAEGKIDRYNVGPESIVDVNGLTYFTQSGIDTKPAINANQPSNKTFADGESFTRMIKSQGQGSITEDAETGEVKKDKVFEFKAPSTGTVSVYARSGASGTDATVYIASNGTIIGQATVIKTDAEKEIEGFQPPVISHTGDFFKDDLIQIYSDNNTSYYAIKFTPSGAASAAAVPPEGVKSISNLKGGETIKVYAEADNAGDTITLSTDPNAEVKDLGGGYYEFTMPAANTTVNATFTSSGGEEPGASAGPEASNGPDNGLPPDVIWRADDPEVIKAWDAVEKDGSGNAAAAFEGAGATIAAGGKIASKNAKYTHSNGQEYSFSRSYQGGSGSEQKTSIAIVPAAEACTVTVVFDGNGSAGRAQTIHFGGEEIASVPSENGITTVTADLTKEDIAAHPGEPIYTWGGGSNKNVYAMFIEYYVQTPDKKISGSVTNKTGRDLTGKNIVFTNVNDPTDVYTAPFGEDYVIPSIKKGETYTVSIEGEPDICTTTDTKTIEITKNKYDMTDVNLTFVLIQDLDVKGTVYTITSHDLRTPVYPYDSAIGAKLSFTKKGEEKPYAEAEVAADGTYTAKLMSNEEYDVVLTTAEGQAYTLSDKSKTYLLEGGDENPFKNILLMKDGPETVEYKDTLTVGPDKEYKSISEAIAAVRLMTREAGQIVNILIDPGTYQEQVYVDVDDIALKAADPAAAEKGSDKRPLVTWYYGIGYVYYSVENGWFNADNFVQKTAQSTASNWGAAIRTLNRGFYMENIDAQSSFNLSVTQQEIDDGVTPGGGDAKVGVLRDEVGKLTNNRTYNERAAAIFAGGSEIEIYNCTFVSSQDTFGTGAKSMYVKDCMISGNTDYICGGDNCYFENCELRWQGMSDVDNGGYITATKNSAATDLGYYFKNCTITKNPDPTMKAGAGGNWGRPWGGKQTVTIYDNTTIGDGVSKPKGWTSMSGSTPADATYYVVNGVFKDGKDITDKNDNPNGTYDANGYTLPTPEQYFGGWTPVNYAPAQ